MSATKKKIQRREAEQAQGLTEKQKQDLKKAADSKRNTMLAVIAGVIVAILVIALLLWHSGVFTRHATALTVKDKEYSVADMNFFYQLEVNSAYNNQQYMAQLYEQMGYEAPEGFDPNGDLTTQYVDEEKTKSYHQQFLESAKANVTEYTAYYDAAKAAGYTLPEEAQKELDSALTNLDAMCTLSGISKRSFYLEQQYGAGMTEDSYLEDLEIYLTAVNYKNDKSQETSEYTDEELEAYYKENPNALDSYNYNYAYFDGTVAATKDADGNDVQPTDEEKSKAMAEAKAEAEALMEAVKAAEKEEPAAQPTATPAPTEGDQTPAEGGENTYVWGEGTTSTETKKKDFEAVAQEQGITNSTVRSKVLGANFSSAVYGEWLMDSARKDGDMDMFEVENAGYYVIQYHSRARNDEPTIDVRHILFTTAYEDDPDTADVDESQNTPDEARIAEVKAQASDILKQFNLGEQTAEEFGKLADEHSADGRDSEGNLNKPGGLYEKVAPGDMVQPFNDWCFDSSRKPGDTGLVQTDYGWHVMYFQAYNEPTWKTKAQELKSSADLTAWQESVTAGYEATEGEGFSQIHR